MKLFVSSLILIISSISFAGGSGGGGGVRPIPDPKLAREMVFHIGEKNGQLKFAYAKLLGKTWKVENIQIDPSKLTQEGMAAILGSSKTKTWVDIE